jgi:hypothetical protein
MPNSPKAPSDGRISPVLFLGESEIRHTITLL